MSKPKFTWELPDSNLLLKVSNGDRETTWRIKKNCGMSDLYTIFTEVASVIDEALLDYSDVRMQKFSENIGPDVGWPGESMVEQCRTVDEDELQAALAAKVAGVTLTGPDWWSGRSAQDLELYEDDPE